MKYRKRTKTFVGYFWGPIGNIFYAYYIIAHLNQIGQHFMRNQKQFYTNHSKNNLNYFYLVDQSEQLKNNNIKVFTVFVYFNTPLELKKKFSDGSPRFKFEWVISGQICKIDLALKSKFTRENLRFSKTFQTGLGVLSSRGVLKYTKTVKLICLKIFVF